MVNVTGVKGEQILVLIFFLGILAHLKFRQPLLKLFPIKNPQTKVPKNQLQAIQIIVHLQLFLLLHLLHLSKNKTTNLIQNYFNYSKRHC